MEVSLDLTNADIAQGERVYIGHPSSYSFVDKSAVVKDGSAVIEEHGVHPARIGSSKTIIKQNIFYKQK